MQAPQLQGRKLYSAYKQTDMQLQAQSTCNGKQLANFCICAFMSTCSPAGGLTCAMDPDDHIGVLHECDGGRQPICKLCDSHIDIVIVYQVVHNLLLVQHLTAVLGPSGNDNARPPARQQQNRRR